MPKLIVFFSLRMGAMNSKEYVSIMQQKNRWRELKVTKKYCVYSNTPLNLTPSSERFKLGNSFHDSLCKIIIRFPIDPRVNYLELETNVINTDTRILFRLDKMKQYGWYVNEVTNELICHKDPYLRLKLKLKLGHLNLEWPPSVVLFSCADLVKLHRRFARPSARKVFIILRKAEPDQ